MMLSAPAPRHRKPRANGNHVARRVSRAVRLHLVLPAMACGLVVPCAAAADGGWDPGSGIALAAPGPMVCIDPPRVWIAWDGDCSGLGIPEHAEAALREVRRLLP